MGFKVDTAEIKTAIDNYQKTATAANEQLVSAKTSMNGIITSNAMQGQVGQAIAADINNNQNAVIVGLADSYTAVAMEMTQLYQSFKSTTGETSDSAVINQEALDKAKTSIDSLKTAHKSVETTIHNIYFGVADLISLTLPKSEFNETADEVKKYVDKIIEKVTTFDSQQGKSTNEDMLAKLKTQIQSAEKVGGLSYTDPQFLAFANSTGLAEDVQDYHSSLSAEAEKLRKEKEKDLNSMTPSEMVAKYGVDDPDVKKRINDINNGISYTALTGLNNGVQAGSHLITGNLIAKETIASVKKINNRTWYRSSVQSTKSGFKTWKQVNGDVNRFKSVKGAKNIDELFNGTGKISSGLKGVGYLGAAGAVFDGATTFYERKNQYGATSAAIDGTAHAASAAGSIYAGAAIGSLIPIPVVGTVAGAVSGYLVNGLINTVYDGFAHGDWNLDNFKLW